MKINLPKLKNTIYGCHIVNYNTEIKNKLPFKALIQKKIGVPDSIGYPFVINSNIKQNKQKKNVYFAIELLFDGSATINLHIENINYIYTILTFLDVPSKHISWIHPKFYSEKENMFNKFIKEMK